MSGFVIEEETGTVTRSARTSTRHEGYYAGHITTSSPQVLQAWFAWGRSAVTA